MVDAVSVLAARLQLTLRQRRYDLRLTQATLAAQIGTTKSQLNRWENLTVTPSGATLLRWCRALDMRLLCVPMGERARRNHARVPDVPAGVVKFKTRRGFTRHQRAYHTQARAI